jgi:hypothetical protein
MSGPIVRRHPVRGLLGGLLLGLGVVLLVFAYGILPMTVVLLGAFVLGGAAVGVALAYVTPPRHVHAPGS